VEAIPVSRDRIYVGLEVPAHADFDLAAGVLQFEDFEIRADMLRICDSQFLHWTNMDPPSA
jgi:hypothetical protein